MPQRLTDKLTALETNFVSEYTKDWNGVRAAKRAGYSPNSAADNAHSALQRPQVQKALAEQMKPRENENRRTADWTLTKLEHLAAITSDEKGAHYNARNGIRALELLGKHHRLFTEQIEITTREDLGEKIAEARQRAKLTVSETRRIDAKTGDQITTRSVTIEGETDSFKEFLS